MSDTIKKYVPKTYPNLKGLKGISDDLLATHFKLYEGYVNRCNALTETLWKIAKEGRASGKDPAYAEMTRRMGFEYSGMVLHEYYFGNLTPNGQAAPPKGKFTDALEKSFGSVETWLADFKAVATMPGVGWAILYQDPTTGWLSNHWINLHQDNHPAGYAPVLVMDAWEHAFLPDYKATERAKYVDAYFQNIDWASAEKRLR
jgi:Fe-Mn family superoxide dismutase